MISHKNEIILLFIYFIFLIIFIIISILDLIILNRLYKSFKYYYSLIEYLFNVNIAEFIWNEVTYLDNAFFYTCYNIFFLIFFAGFALCLCKNSLEYIPINSKRLLDQFIKNA